MNHIYTRTKIFHYKDKLHSLSPNADGILPPVHIRIKPTNVCNHNCWYCAYRADHLQLGKDMVLKDHIPREKMLEILEDLVDMQVQAVTFSGGGEPFCYPYLAEAVKYLAQTTIKFAAITNGSLLKGEISELFAKHAVWLRVSIDGWDSASYSSYRNVGRDEFDKVIDNMKEFKKLAGKCFLGASVVIDKTNAAHVYEFIKTLENAGVDSIKVSPCIIENDGNKNNRYHRPFFNEVKQQLQKAKQKLENENVEIFDAYHDLEKTFTKDYCWCPYLQILPVIAADQNVYCCQDKAYNLDEGLLGSIKNKRFKNFWRSDRNKFFKIDPSRDCNHHCTANAKNKMVLEYLKADNDHLGFV